MDVGHLFTRAAQLLWRHKFLWWWGLLAALGRIGGNLGRAYLNVMLSTPEALPTQSDRWLHLLAGRSPLWWSGWMLIAVSVGLALWLVMLLAEGGLIGATLADDRGKPVTPGRAWRAGSRLLLRFVAIDTVVFFPLFLLSLLLIGAPTLGLIVGVVTMPNSDAILAPVALGLLCGVAALCIAIPVLVLTLLWRVLAFRETAVSNKGVRSALRRSWRVARRYLANVVVLALLLGGLSYVVNAGLGLMSWPLLSLLAQVDAARWLLWAVALAVWLALAVPQAVVHAFVAVAWTLAYREMATGDTDLTD